MFEDTNGTPYSPSPGPGQADARRNREFAPLIVKCCLGLVMASFAFPDIFLYPFRMFSAGPHGLYGTWTGVVKTDASETSLAVVQLQFRPPLFDPAVRMFWRPSRYLDATMDVYGADGRRSHCTERLGTIDERGQMELLVYGGDKNTNAVDEAEVTPGRIEFLHGQCPVGDKPASFTGVLTPGAAGDVAGLLAQLPARSKALEEALETADTVSAGEWIGTASTWDPDDGGRPAPNAAMRLFLERAGAETKFTAHGEVQSASGAREVFTMPEVTIKGGALLATGKFRDVEEPEFTASHGGLQGEFHGDTLQLQGGKLMMYAVAGALRHGTDGDYRQAVAALPRAAH